MQSIITSIIVAVGLSMDAFSLSILYGTLGLSIRKIILLSVVVGVFHFFMPIIGNLFGSLITKYISVNLDIVVGLIFLVIAGEMIMSLFKKEEVKSITGIASLLLFGFTVSIDSFSVGIGLKALTNDIILTVSIFSIISLLFTFTGLLIGKKLNDVFGRIATMIGGFILIGLGYVYIFL